jgi:hypothetical protein
MFSIIGSTSDGDLLIWGYFPGPAEFLLSSGESVAPPPDAIRDHPPFVIDGRPIWRTGAHTLIDGTGTVVLDLSAVVRERADIRDVIHHPEGGYAVTWLDNRAWGIAIARDDVVRAYDVTALGGADFVWLDERRLIASVQYRTETLGDLGLDGSLSGSRTPSIVDIEHGTIHPIAEFLRTGAPRGRNYVEGVWWE